MKHFVLIFILSIACLPCLAQDTTSLLYGYDDRTGAEKITGTFKSTRVINALSTEMLHKGELDFRIMHRFGVVNNGFKDLFGLDNASMRMSFDYGINDKLMLGIGRSTILKDLDLFVKTRILQQTKGQKQMPVSLLLAAGYILTTQESFAAVKPTVVDRSSYFFQMIIGRKFNSVFSAQLSPLLVYNNMTLNPTDDQAIVGLGGGARYKVSKRIALMVDYHYVIGKLDASITNPLSVGFDIETGGHVFQLHFSNVTGMNEKGYLTQTTGKFSTGNFRFGFNLSRRFSIGKRHRKSW
ncbi:MAG: hypothetical protein IPI54_02205 [Chitinophagaceae bacterium]|nr:hypothetical protein [Chitinophagaceae bacterium]